MYSHVLTFFSLQASMFLQGRRESYKKEYLVQCLTIGAFTQIVDGSWIVKFEDVLFLFCERVNMYTMND